MAPHAPPTISLVDSTTCYEPEPLAPLPTVACRGASSCGTSSGGAAYRRDRRDTHRAETIVSARLERRLFGSSFDAASSIIARTTALTLGSMPVRLFNARCRFRILAWSGLLTRVATMTSASGIPVGVTNVYRQNKPCVERLDRQRCSGLASLLTVETVEIRERALSIGEESSVGYVSAQEQGEVRTVPQQRRCYPHASE